MVTLARKRFRFSTCSTTFLSFLSKTCTHRSLRLLYDKKQKKGVHRLYLGSPTEHMARKANHSRSSILLECVLHVSRSTSQTVIGLTQNRDNLETGLCKDGRS